ncbi:MAG: DHA2 family efflux MFS transporter permease subunit [Acidimicrobiia bacterium]|nr:DHA2 family efflux MFS transporter permease subunit [Acidimicrobiia bacterium]
MAATAVTFGSTQGRWVLLASILGSGVAGLDATVVNVALLKIGEDLGGGTAGLQWTLNGYLLTLSALILLGGSLGDRFGRRRVFVIGVIWFAAASLLCGIAPDIGALVTARALQGVGAALLTPGSLSLLQASFVAEDRGRAIGAWSAFGGIATAIGPFVGGYLVDAASWRWIFLLNLPVAAAVVLITLRHVPESSDPEMSREIDYAGAVLGAVGLAGMTYALVEAPERGATSPVIVAAAVVGVCSLVGFVVVERRSEHPMLPLDIFASAQFTSANFMTFAMYAALGGMFFLLATYLQVALGYSPIESGIALFPVTILMLLLSERAGALATRIGPLIPMTVGPLVVAAGLLLMARIEPGSTYATSVLPAAVVFGLGLALTVAPLTATVLAAADNRHSGVASGVNNAVARVAQLLAVAVLPIAAGITGDDSADPGAFAAGFRNAAFITAALAATAGAVSWLMIRDDVLAVDADDGVHHAPATSGHYHCAADGPPLRQPPALTSR